MAKLKTLAVIPARGNSKGVPGKNIRLLGGIPLILHAIQTARESKRITDFAVNTDSEAIAAVARDAGAAVIMRPPQMALDDSPVMPAVIQTLNACQKETGEAFDLVVLLQPTSPFRTGEDADRIVSMLEQDATIDGVISVVPVGDHHPARMYSVDESGHMQHVWDQDETGHRQQLKELYIRNGCFYAVRTSALIRENTLMVQKKAAYVMQEKWHVNIDTEKDFLLATVMVDLWNNQNSR